MSTRKMDRWWTVLIAFIVAAAMVLLVVIAMDGTTDGAAEAVRDASARFAATR